MYAIVDVKDKQFKVREDDTLYVPYHSEAEADQELTLDRVLLVSDGEGDVTLGTPTVEDASVTARVLEHVKGDKVIVFKKKRRKRYRVKRGHRQQYTQVQIESLNLNGATDSSEAAESEAVEADETEADDAPDEMDTDETEDAVDEAEESSESDEEGETEEAPETAETEEPKAESDEA
jgi:large subunit ribosomal protein L21